VVIKGAVIVLAVAIDQAQQRLQKRSGVRKTQASLTAPSAPTSGDA